MFNAEKKYKIYTQLADIFHGPHPMQCCESECTLLRVL